MNDVLKNLYSRKSVRIFTSQPIGDEEKRTILEAACQAPTACNEQRYTILDITDQKKLEQLAVSCDNQPFIATSKLTLIFCADCLKWYTAFEEGGCAPRKPDTGDLVMAITDAALAAQNAVTAAESLGIGSCFIGDIIGHCEEFRQLFSLPSYVFPCLMLVLGYPTEQQKTREKTQRCDMGYIVHENDYRPLSGGDVREMLAHKLGSSSYEQWTAAFCKSRYNCDCCDERTRSIGVYLKDFTKD